MKRLVEKYKGTYRKPDNVPDNWQNACIHKLGIYEEIEELCERFAKGKTVYMNFNNSDKIYSNTYSNCDITYNFAKRRIEVYNCNLFEYFDVDEYGETWSFKKKDLEE